MADAHPITAGHERHAGTAHTSAEPPSVALARYPRPYDWSAIDATITDDGGCVLEALIAPETVAALNAEVDAYLGRHPTAGRPHSGSDLYDRFLGAQTIRLHGLIAKFDLAAQLVSDPDVVGWAERVLGADSNGIQLNAAELIQIEPGESAQYPHRDSDSWPAIPLGGDPIIANAIVALDATTLDNGATWVAPGSHRWETGRRVGDAEWSRAELAPGDAVAFRGDVVHRGGANHSDARRRVVSLSYCVGWLRPVENSFLNLDRDVVATLAPRLRALVGYEAHVGANGGMIGLYENGDPADALPATALPAAALPAPDRSTADNR